MHQQRGADAAITAPQDDAGVAGPEAAVLEPAPVSHRPSSRSDTVQSTGPEAAGRELLGVPQADPGGIAETTVRNRRYAVRRSHRLASFRSNDGGDPWTPSPITEPSMSAVAPIVNGAGEATSSRSIGPSINCSPSWMRGGGGCS